MFYFIGLGLSDEKDITVRGLEVVKRAERVYLESYTAILMVGKEKLVGAPRENTLSEFLSLELTN
jgi:diphthine synthase